MPVVSNVGAYPTEDVSGLIGDLITNPIKAATKELKNVEAQG